MEAMRFGWQVTHNFYSDQYLSGTCVGDYKNDPQFDAQCNVIEGRLIVYLSDVAFSNSTEVAVLNEIASIMDDGLLDNSHPAI
jgi:hypothetical protein